MELLTTPLKGSTNNSIYYNWQNNNNHIFNSRNRCLRPCFNIQRRQLVLAYINPSKYIILECIIMEHGLMLLILNPQLHLHFLIVQETMPFNFL